MASETPMTIFEGGKLDGGIEMRKREKTAGEVRRGDKK